MTAWTGTFVAVAVVVSLRAAYVVGNARLRLPRWFDRIGAVLAPVVTAALVAPRVFATTGHPAIGPEAVAFCLATAVAVRTRSVAWTIAIGMPLLWILRAVW